MYVNVEYKESEGDAFIPCAFLPGRPISTE